MDTDQSLDRRRFTKAYSAMKLASTDLTFLGPAPTWLTEATKSRMMKSNRRAIAAGEKTQAPPHKIAELVSWDSVLQSIKPYPTLNSSWVTESSMTQKQMRKALRPKGRVPRNKTSRTELEISITALEARRIELGAAFRNSYPHEATTLDRHRRELLTNVRSVFQDEASRLNQAELDRLRAVEAAAGKLAREKRKTPYRYVVSGGLPTLGRGR